MPRRPSANAADRPLIGPLPRGGGSGLGVGLRIRVQPLEHCLDVRVRVVDVDVGVHRRGDVRVPSPFLEDVRHTLRSPHRQARVAQVVGPEDRLLDLLAGTGDVRTRKPRRTAGRAPVPPTPVLVVEELGTLGEEKVVRLLPLRVDVIAHLIHDGLRNGDSPVLGLLRLRGTHGQPFLSDMPCRQVLDRVLNLNLVAQPVDVAHSEACQFSTPHAGPVGQESEQPVPTRRDVGDDRLCLLGREGSDAQVLVGDAPEVELQRRSGTLSDVALGRCVREHDASDSEDAVLSLFLEALGPNV